MVEKPMNAIGTTFSEKSSKLEKPARWDQNEMYPSGVHGLFLNFFAEL